jgi:class 3 adenylate cyclase
LHFAGLLQGPEDLAYNARMRYFNTVDETDRIVHIDLTDQSFDLVAPWPWPRRLTADLVRTLHELGAEIIALDLEFKRPKDPRRTSEMETIDDDAELADAIADAGNVFVPLSFKLLPPGRSLAGLRSRAREALRADPHLTPDQFNRRLGDHNYFGRAGLLRFRMGELLREEFGLSALQLAERLNVTLEEVTAIWAGVKRAVARELVEDSLHDHPEADLNDIQDAILGVAESAQVGTVDPGDAQDLAEAYRWCRSMQAACRLAGSDIEAARDRIPEIIAPRPPLERIGAAAAGTGFVSFTGLRNVVRSTPFLTRYGDYVFKQLGFAVACRAAGIADRDIRVTQEGFLEFPNPRAPDRLLRVPLGRDGTALINWSPGRRERSGAGSAPWLSSFRHIPAARIMEIPTYKRELERNARAWLLAKAAAVELTNTPSMSEAYWRDVQELQQLKNAPPEAQRDSRIAELEAKTRGVEARALEGIALAWDEMKGREPESPEEAEEFDGVRRAYQDLVLGRLRPELDRLDERARRRIAERTASLRPLIEGKICLVGYTASAIADMKPTPVYDIAPGVMAHSNIINQVLAGRMPRYAPSWLSLAVTALCGLGVAWIAASVPAITSAAVWVLASAAYAAINVLIYRQSDMFLALVAPLAAMLGAWGAVTAYRQLTEERERRRFSKALAQYVSPAVAKRLAHQTDRLDMSPVAREVTCFFSDLKGFTTLSDRLGPERTRAVLNPYLQAMSAVLHENGAMINKFMGDGIFAFFNAPILACENHAERACHAASASFEALERLKAAPPADCPPAEMANLSMRIGLATGTVFVGDYGSDTKLDYTAIGDPVNLAARLEPANKVFGTRIALAETTRTRAGDRFAFRRLGLIRVVGKTEGVPVYELLAPSDRVDGKFLEHAELFEAALEAWQARDFETARRRFEQCLALRSEDLCTKHYLRMISEFQANPPGDAWQPVIELTSK